MHSKLAFLIASACSVPIFQLGSLFLRLLQFGLTTSTFILRDCFRGDSQQLTPLGAEALSKQRTVSLSSGDVDPELLNRSACCTSLSTLLLLLRRAGVLSLFLPPRSLGNLDGRGSSKRIIQVHRQEDVEVGGWGRST